jgi:DNA polymerase III delta subunit
VATVILISGEEELLMERAALDEAASMLPDSVLRFRDAALYAEEAACRPIGGGRRVFIVWSSSVPRLPADPDVLIVVSKKKLDLATAARRLDFPKLKTYDDKNEVVAWVIKEGDRRNIDLRRVATGLFVNSRKSLRKLASEVRKLSVLVPSGPVTPEDVRSVLPFSADLTPKEIVEAVCEGYPVKAVAYVDRLQEANDETGWIIAFLQRHVIQQLRVELLSASGLGPQDVAKRIEMHPFVFKKVVEPRLGLWKPSSLRFSLAELCRLDLAHKRGKKSAVIGLEAEVIRLSEEAKNNVKRSRAN